MSPRNPFFPQTTALLPIYHSHKSSSRTSHTSSTSNPESIALSSLSPRSFSPPSPIPPPPRHTSANVDSEAAKGVEPSPPSSFYRSSNPHRIHHMQSQSSDQSRGSSVSRSPSRGMQRKIQFAAPPPPIVSSVILPAPSPSQRHLQNVGTDSRADMGSTVLNGTSAVGRKRGAGADPLLALERREIALQKELQGLLDAQSVGLVEGFGGGAAGGEGSEGSSTPTVNRNGRESIMEDRNVKEMRGSVGVVPVRQPKKKAVGLRGARSGLLRDMHELIGIKDEEVNILERETERRKELLGKIMTWERRIEGFRNELEGYSDNSAADGEAAVEIRNLRAEEVAVDAEIRDMEERLLEMRARKRWLGVRIRECVDREEARMSSYRGALKEVEAEVQQFLKHPPTLVSLVRGDEEGFMHLPYHRRTLGLAKEWWEKGIPTLESRTEETEREKLALEEGAAMWEDSVLVVTEFEDDLRKHLVGPAVQDTGMLAEQVRKMGIVIAKLEGHFKVAEEKGWNLLICAVGAELEAFREGERILREALEGSKPQVRKDERAESQDGWDSDKAHSHGPGDDAVDNVIKEMHSVEQVHEQTRLAREDSEDDGRTLEELLIDHGADDAS